MNRPAQLDASMGVQPYAVTADDYLRMVDAGAFGDAHVELFDGVLVQMAPSHSKHGRLLMVLARLLGNAYEKTGFELYGDTITLFDKLNIRAPDIAVVDRDIGESKTLTPGDILLVVEIAGSTLGLDLGRKRTDYAAAGIRNYWVVDIEGLCVHTFAEPQGTDYRTVAKFGFDQAVPTPGASGAITIA